MERGLPMKKRGKAYVHFPPNQRLCSPGNRERRFQNAPNSMSVQSWSPLAGAGNVSKALPEYLE